MNDEDLQGTPIDTGLFPMFFWLVFFPFALVGIGHFFGVW